MTGTKSAIAIGAHPDDIEFFMAGTLLLLKQRGYSIHYWNLANGCCGTTQYDRETIIEMRRAEAMAAAELAGAKYYESICDDLGIFYEPKALAKVAAGIRVAQPEIVLTHSPSDYMEDHMNACRLAVTAAFARGMPNFPTDPPQPTFDAPLTVYHAQPFSHSDPLRVPIEPDYWVNVESVLEQKVELLAQHRSQKDWLDESQGHDSYLETLRQLDAEGGKRSGRWRYAEGWRRHLHLGFCSPEDDPLSDALSDLMVPAT